MKKVLFVCSESSPGMRDYAIPIICAARKVMDVYALFVDNHEKTYFDYFPYQDDSHFVSFRQPENKIQKLFFRIWPQKIYDTIEHLCEKNNIDVIWSLTGDSMLSPFIDKINKKYKFIYTVHDLTPHDAVYKSLVEKLKFELFFINREKNIREKTSFLASNSKSQIKTLEQLYPRKRVSYYNFPSLVNVDKLGNLKCKEMEGVDKYILFFGRIEKYKGLEYLYEAFLNSPKLQQYKLVIAGSGFLYFERDLSKEENVIFINRFISDDEVAPLFANASAVVYPYVSATQSGVMSLAYYFNKPLLLSDIPFFRDCAIDGETALFFKNQNSEDLQKRLEMLMEDEVGERMRNAQTLFYKEMYSEETLMTQLQSIIESISE